MLSDAAPAAAASLSAGKVYSEMQAEIAKPICLISMLTTGLVWFGPFCRLLRYLERLRISLAMARYSIGKFTVTSFVRALKNRRKVSHAGMQFTHGVKAVNSRETGVCNRCIA